MRFVVTQARLGNSRFWGVWDTQRKKLVNLEIDLELRRNKAEAQQDADRLNKTA